MLRIKICCVHQWEHQAASDKWSFTWVKFSCVVRIQNKLLNNEMVWGTELNKIGSITGWQHNLIYAVVVHLFPVSEVPCLKPDWVIHTPEKSFLSSCNIIYLAFFLPEMFLHLSGVLEFLFVPSKIPLAICVLYIQPYGIIRNVMCIKASIHCLDILLILIIPPALMVAQRKKWGQGLSAYKEYMNEDKTVNKFSLSTL